MHHIDRGPRDTVDPVSEDDPEMFVEILSWTDVASSVVAGMLVALLIWKWLW